VVVAIGAEVVRAARTLAALGLVTAFGHVSARLGADVVITPAADLAHVAEGGLVRVALDSTGLPPGAPAETWAHLALYRARPDAAAIARAQPPAAFAAAAVVDELRPLHGQAAWLGVRIPVHDDARLLRSPELAARAAARLPVGEALLLRGNGALTLGATPGIAVARMWLLTAACEARLAAGDGGRALSTVEVESWRAAADELLPRLWAHLSSRAATAEAKPYMTDGVELGSAGRSAAADERGRA
jgi:HCOMODA/2-hydroxy-3-carboxy-muconic semialdehyde decarboxylase